MKKFVGIAVVVGLVAVGACFAAWKWVVPRISKLGDMGKLTAPLVKSKEEMPPETSWVTDEWQHSVVLNRAVRVRSPFPLYPEDQLTFGQVNQYIKAFDSTSGSQDGVRIEASLVIVRDDAVFNLRRATESGVSDYIKSKGVLDLKEQVKDHTVMGRRAREFEIHGNLKGKPIQIRGLLFGSGRNGVLVCVNGHGDDARIPVVWERLKSGIGDANAALPPVKTTTDGPVSGMESGSPGLPAGFAPRNPGVNGQTAQPKAK